MFDYPGSTEIVTWKESLPEYIWIEEHSIKGKMVVAEFGDSLETAIDRYHESNVFATIADVIFSNNEQFDDCSDEEEAFEMIFEEYDSKNHLACPEDSVEVHL